MLQSHHEKVYSLALKDMSKKKTVERKQCLVDNGSGKECVFIRFLFCTERHDYSKIIISRHWGEVKVSSRLPQGLKNNVHVFGSYDLHDSIAATLTGFITLTMFLMCSNPITIMPMR